MLIQALALLLLAQPAPLTLRVATFNVEDLRSEDLARDDAPRVKRLAEVIQRLRPNIILINEIAYDMPGAPGSPGVSESKSPGLNAQRFIDHYLSKPQARGVEPLKLKAFMAASNTGMPSGLDLDNDGTIASQPPPVPTPDGSPGRPSEDARKFGNDCWGFGTFPGQYAMALLVDERLTIDEANARTFRLLPWDYMPGAFLPTTADHKPWFSDEELKLARLSSKSHWDVPVKLTNGSTLHVLCSHPTPPAFDGPEQRHKKRNHDEIRFWADYLDDQPWIVDDLNKPGGLPPRTPFVILGDLNADPDEGDSFKNPMKLLLANPRLKKHPAPTSEITIKGLDPDDTSRFKLRVDYVLTDRDQVASGVWRENHDTFPSDHFPVWADITVPPPTN